MAIDINNFDLVVTAVNEYRGLVKMRDALLNGTLTFVVSYNANKYDMIAQFGEDTIKGIIVTPLNNFLNDKKQALIGLGVAVP